MTRTATKRTVAAFAAAGLVSVALAATPATAHADEISPYLGWQEPARPGDCPAIFVSGLDVFDGGVVTVNPEEHSSGWIVDSDTKDAVGDKNTRWAQNGVAETRVTIGCDYGSRAFTRKYTPTRYQHRYSWTGSQCLIEGRSGTTGCSPYYIPGTDAGWQDGLARASR